MKGRRYGKQVACRLLTSQLGIVVCLVVAAQPAFAEESPPISAGQTQTGSGTSVHQPAAEQPAAAPEGAAGVRVYIDPQTGQIRSTPAPGTETLELTPQERNARSTSHDGLVQVPLPGGGFKLDLQGRFQSPLIGTIDANGKVRIQHLHEPRQSGDKN